MKVILAIFSGSATAAIFALSAQWLLSGSASPPAIQSAAVGAPGLSLFVTAAALVVGAWVAVRIQDSFETLTGYGTVQLFFGPALIREFWLGGAPWYAAIAICIVIPLTFIGGVLGSRRHLKDLLQAA